MQDHRQHAQAYLDSKAPPPPTAIGPTWLCVVFQILVMLTTPALLVGCWVVGYYGHAWCFAGGCLICLILVERENGGFFTAWYPSQIRTFWKVWHGR